MAYELLAGSPPFTGSTAQAVLARHAVDPVPRRRTVRRTVPAGVGAGDRAGLGQCTRRSIRGGRRICRCHWGEAWGRPPVLASSAPSAASIAVLPFRVPRQDTALMRLGRDLATTVSATLGGVGGIRTADRMSIASEFQSMDVTSPAAAAELGRRLGAGSGMRGALVGDGITVRLDLGLFDTEGLAPLAQGITVSGHRNSDGVLTDSIVWALLRQIWRAVPCGPAMAVWCFSRSTPATSRCIRMLDSSACSAGSGFRTV